MRKNLLRLSMLFATLLFCFTSYAYDFEVNGIYYNITSAEDLTVEVTYKEEYQESYTVEALEIPSSVEYNGKKYAVTRIGNDAIGNSSNLTDVTIPASVLTIGDNAFAECTKLISLVIPESVTSLGDGLCYNCKSLNSVTVKGTMPSLGNETFLGCESLNFVMLPTTITSIGASAFSGCDSLKTLIVLSASVPSAGEGCFSDCVYDITKLYVNMNISADCGDVAPWNKFTNIIDVDPSRMSDADLCIDSLCGTWYEKTTMQYCPDQEWLNYSIANSPVTVTKVGENELEFANLFDISEWRSTTAIGVVDMYAKTITFAPQTVSFDGYDWLMSGGYDDASVPVSATINANGSITMNGVYMNYDYYGDGNYYSYTYNSETTLTRDTVYVKPDEDATPIDFSGKLIKVGDQAENFVACSDTTDMSHWYLLEQDRDQNDDSNILLTPIYDCGLNKTIYRAESTEAVVDDAKASDDAIYLVRFLPGSNPNSYYIQFGTGRYVSPSLKSSVTPGEFNVYLINDTPGHFGINVYNYGSIVDNNGAGYSIALWSTGKVDYTGGNNDWTLVEISLYDDPTSIKKVQGTEAVTTIYNIAGQKISAPRKGVNIINGKKIVY